MSERRRAHAPRLPWLLLGPALLAAPPATAWQKREETIVATQSAAGPARKGPPGHPPAAPELRPEDVFAGRGEELGTLVAGQLKVLQRLLAATPPGDPDRPDLLFRMAEHCAEQQRIHRLRARALDEPLFRAERAGLAKEARDLRAQRADHEQREKDWLRQAVTYYLKVANGPAYAGYRKMDQVLYALASLLQEIKKDDQARVYFRRLIQDHPSSPYLSHAFLSFAEAAFAERDLENALRFYDRVLALGEGPLYGFALYKKGWVYYNLGDLQKALAAFASVIERQAARQGARGKGDAQLLREARRDLVRTYAQIGGADHAWAFVQRHGGVDTPALFEQLAEHYFALGRFSESIRAYRELIRRYPDGPRLCAWQSEVLRGVLALAGGRATDETVKELTRLSAVHDRIAGQAGPRQEVARECREVTAGMLRDLATGWHREAQRTRDAATFTRAAVLYREYLRRFAGEKDGLRYYYGELLYQLGQMGGADGAAPGSGGRWFCEAAPVYTEVARREGQGARARDAAFAAVVSWNHCLDLDRQREPELVARPPDAPPPRPRPLPEPQRLLLEAMRTYVRLVPPEGVGAGGAGPTCGDRAVIVYRWARTLYLHEHLAEAVPLFREVTARHGTCPQGLPAANLLLDSLNLLRDDRALAQEIARLRAAPAFASLSERELPLETIEIGLLRREIERSERGGAHREAGLRYLQLAERFPRYPRLDEVYSNAAVSLERARLIGLAVQARQRLIQLYPESPLAKRAIFRLAQGYHSLAFFEQAADHYEQFAASYGGEIAADPSDETQVDAPRALRTAAFFRRGLGQTERAIEDVRRFVRAYGQGKDPGLREQAAAAFFELAQVYEQRGERERLRRHLVEYLQTWAEIGGLDRRIVAEVRLGLLLWQQSCKIAGQNGACIEVERVRASRAQALLAQAAQRGRRLRREPEALRQCGPPTKSRITVHPRDPVLAREAMARFQRARALWQERGQRMPKDDPARAQLVRYHLALARMAEGDQRYEETLSLRMPAGLNFAQRGREYEASKARLQRWYMDKARRIDAARGIYENMITAYQEPHHAIAAAARIGQLYQDFANTLYTAEVPQPPRPPAGIDRAAWGHLFRQAYCDEMEDLARIPEDKAVEGLSLCLRKSADLSWYNEWSQLCEAELNQIKPAEYPLAAEIRPEPGYLSLRLDMAPVLWAERDDEAG